MQQRHLLVRRVISWSLVILWMGLIFWFSAQNGDRSSALSGGLIEKIASMITPHFADWTEEQQAEVIAQWQFIVRKLAHFTEYALLGVLMMLALSAHTHRMLSQILIAAAIGLLYAAGDEWHQSFVPGRGPGIRDVCIDFLGALTGILLSALIAVIWRRRRLRRQNHINEQ